METTERKAVGQRLIDTLAEVLQAKLASGEADAATLNVARQFCKDHGIEFDMGTKSKTPVVPLTKTIPFPGDDLATGTEG